MTSTPPRTLRAALAAGPLPPPMAVRVAIQLCDALIPDHARGGAAHDVRPESVLLVADTARLTTIPTAGSRDPYVAPERRRGWSAGDARSDVYAIGVVLYEMLVGQTPAGRFAWPGQVNPDARWLDPIVVRCLSDDPAQRYPSAAELRAALLTPAAPPLFARPTPRGTRVAIGVACAVAGVMLLLIALWFLLDHTAVSRTNVAMSPSTFAPSAAQRSFSPPGLPQPSVSTPTPDIQAMQQRLNQISSQITAEHQSRLSQFRFGRTHADTWMGGDTDAAGLLNTPLVGGHGGGAFRKIGGGNRPLLGLTYTYGEWGGNGCLRQVDPIYDAATPAVSATGQRSGTIMAGDGYAVGGLLVEADDTNAIAMAVVFMGYRNGKLVPTDRYTSAWVGFPVEGRAQTQLAADGRPVVGVCGRQGMNLDALGLVVATR